MEMEQESEVTILQLNDGENNCLRYVLSHLNVRELMVAEEVCVMFKTVAEDIYRTRRFLDFDFLINWNEEAHKIPQEEVEKIFTRVGPHLETLKLNKNCTMGNPLKSVWEYCRNLQSVTLKEFKFNNEICTNLSRVFTNVRDVNLDDCHKLNDNQLQNMFNLQHIKKLSVSTTNVHGDFLEHLQDIQHIILMDCKLLKPHKFISFIEAHTQLIALDILHCTTINEACLRAIARNLTNLEELIISCDPNVAPKDCYYHLVTLPKLKSLMLHQSSDRWKDISVLIEKLATRNQLERLIIDFGYNEITPTTINAFKKVKNIKKLGFKCITHSINVLLLAVSRSQCSKTLEELYVRACRVREQTLIDIIERCTKINYIDVSYCNNLTEEFIPFIRDALEGRNHKLQIMCPCSAINKSYLQEPYNEKKLELIS